MRHRLYQLLRLFSMLAFIATPLLWWRSYTYGDSMGIRVLGGGISVSTHPGGLTLAAGNWVPEGTHLLQLSTQPWGTFDIVHASETPQGDDSTTAGYATGHFEFVTYDWPHPNWVFLGFGAGRLDQQSVDGKLPPLHTWLLLIPYWFIGATLLGFTAYGFRSSRIHRQREQLGLCLNCGYDLRASSDRCPECGTKIPTASQANAGH